MRSLRLLSFLGILAATLAQLSAQDQPAPVVRIDFRTLGLDNSIPPLVFITQGSKEVPIVIYAGQRSTFFTYHGTLPINFYAPGASALPPEKRQALAVANIPQAVTHPLLVFLRPDTAGGPWRVAVCEDSTTSFAAGMVRMFNTLPETVRVDVSGTKFDLPPLQYHDLIPVFLKGNMYEVSLQRNTGNGWQETYRSVWDMPKDWRIFALLVLQNGKPTFAKVIEVATYAQSVESRIAADKLKEQKTASGQP